MSWSVSSLSLILLTSLPLSTLVAAPLQAVIGLNNSQVIDTPQEGQLSLKANPHTLLPLQEGFTPIPVSKSTPFHYWLQETGRLIRVDSRLQNLSYTGVLESVSMTSGRFLLTVKNRIIELPINDFYLIPLDKSAPQAQKIDYPASLSYQTEQLFWSPQLSLVIDGDHVTFFQRALLHNNADQAISLTASLLHYSRAAGRIEHSAMAKSALQNDSPQGGVQFTDNEVTYPLPFNEITLAPYSDTLIPLQTSLSPIKHRQHTAQLYTHLHSRGEQSLGFQSDLKISLTDDSLPGVYQIFWRSEDGLLIPAKSQHLEKLRKGGTTTLTTNSSQDISGSMKLISATSTNFPSTQVWQVTLENHSAKRQAFSIFHTSQGLLKAFQGEGLQAHTANSVNFVGELNSHEKRSWQYTLELEK